MIMMTIPRTFRSSVMALLFFASASGFVLSGHAESGSDADLAALQANVKESFRDKVAPFVTTYCTDCHGAKKRKGQINFQPALKNPGDANFSKQWKQALANVKTHDMPPDEADKQPTDEERQMFLDWVAKVKFLSPKDSGPFVIRRLTKVEYGKHAARSLWGGSGDRSRIAG